MSRTKLTSVVILVVVVGFVVGWWLAGRLNPVQLSPVSHGAAQSSAPARITNGYCCLVPGQPCELVEYPSACFEQNGKGFNSRQAVCDNFCKVIGSIQQ